MFRALLAIVILAGVFAARAVAQAPESQETEIAALIAQLYAENSAQREVAAQALGEIGEPAIEPLRKALERGSPQARLRIPAILKRIELDAIPKNAVRLADILAHTRHAADGKVDQEHLEALLERLVAILAKDTETERALPVRFKDVSLVPDVDPVLGLSGRPKLRVANNIAEVYPENCILIAAGVVKASTVRNSIIIAGVAAEVTESENCIILARDQLTVNLGAKNSILLTGGQLSATRGENAIAGGAQRVRDGLLRGRNNIYCNSAAPEDDSPLESDKPENLPRSITSKGIQLDLPKRENPLPNLLTMTDYVGSALFVFQRHKNGSEYAVRLGEPLRGPNGAPIPELEGWQVDYIDVAIAVLMKDSERHIVHRKR
jgi:hypothetical protein